MEAEGLDPSFMEFALGIFLYTIEDELGTPGQPTGQVYRTINRLMFSLERRVTSSGRNADKASAELRDAVPFIKFLKTALERLPPAFHYSGRVYRGVKHV